MLLLGIVLPAAMGGVSLCLRVAGHARHEQEAALLGESQLNLFLAERDVNNLQSGGTFGDDWPDYRWTLATAAGEFGTTRLDLSVEWQEQGATRTLVLSTLTAPTTTTATGGF